MRALSGRVLAGALMFVVAGTGWASAPEGPTSTSVLLVTLDTTRADHLGCYGAAFAATPNLDGLARSGARFDEAISPTPLTLPSHASIFTGRVPRRHGVRDNALFRLGEEPDVLADVLGRHGYTAAAFVSSVVLDRITGLDRGFRTYDDTVRVGARAAFDYRERAAIQTNDAVLRHLDGLEEPFFLWVHYFDPHLPYVPPEPFRSRFSERPYDGEIAFVDQQLGRLLDAVRKKTPSLLVVVAGDHGESLGEHGEDAHGVFLYRATQRVPLVVAGPGVPRGKVVRERVGLVDLAPTVLDLLGLPPLDDVDGRSLVPLMRGEDLPPRAYELESLFPSYAYGWASLRGLVLGGYKYILAPRSELYRTGADPREAHDLVAKEAERASAMEETLHELIADDAIPPAAGDPELAEQRRRLEALGYLSGSGPPEAGDLVDPKDGIGWIVDLAAGREAYQTGRPSEGIEPLRRLLARNPHNVQGWLALAMCYLGTQQADRAVDAGRRALAIRPDDDLVHFNLANAFAVQGERQTDARTEARQHYERALELNPRFADAYLNYASFLERVGSRSEVRPLLERARLAGVRDPDLEVRIGLIELKRGNVESAKAALRRALELNPRAAGPREALRLIEERSPDE
jgi:arylsulfatase A-like enzyme/Tfp pilus assembly protein PilF